MLHAVLLAIVARSTPDAGVRLAVCIPSYCKPNGSPGPRRLSKNGVDQTFQVIETNTSNRPIRIYEPYNSWGDAAITIELVDEKGRKTLVNTMGMAYSKNFPSCVRLLPGESCGRLVPYRRGTTAKFPWPASGTQRFKLSVILRQNDPPQVRKVSPELWQGTARSPFVDIELASS